MYYIVVLTVPFEACSIKINADFIRSGQMKFEFRIFISTRRRFFRSSHFMQILALATFEKLIDRIIRESA